MTKNHFHKNHFHQCRKIWNRSRRNYRSLTVVSVCIALALVDTCPGMVQTVTRIVDLDENCVNRCGAHALASAALMAGVHSSPLGALDSLLPPTGEPAPLSAICNAATKLGLQPVAVRWDRFPRQLPAPAIIQLIAANGMQHYVLVAKVEGNGAYVIDFPHSPVWVPLGRLENDWRWNGVAVHLLSVGDSSFFFWVEVLSLKGRYWIWSLLAVTIFVLWPLRKFLGNPVGSKSCQIPMALFGVIFLCGCNARTHLVQGVIEIQPPTVEFSLDNESTAAKAGVATVTLTNRSASTQEVTSIRTGCGCASAKLDKMKIPEFSSATMTITVEPPGLGEKLTAVVVTLSDRDHPAIKIPVRLIGAPIEMPRVVTKQDSMVTLTRDRPTTVRITTMEDKGTQHWISGLRSSTSAFQAALVGVKQLDYIGLDFIIKTYSFSLSVRPEEFTDKRVVGKFSIQFSFSAPGEIHGSQFTVGLEPIPAFALSQDSLVFEIGPKSAYPLTQTFTAAASTGELASIQLDGPHPAGVRIESESGVAGGARRVSVFVDGDISAALSGKQFLSAAVILTDSLRNEVRVPIVIISNPGGSGEELGAATGTFQELKTAFFGENQVTNFDLRIGSTSEPRSLLAYFE
jgi:Peptidase C39 family